MMQYHRVFSIVLFVIAGYVHQQGNPKDFEYLAYASILFMLDAIFLAVKDNKKK